MATKECEEGTKRVIEPEVVRDLYAMVKNLTLILNETGSRWKILIKR